VSTAPTNDVPRLWRTRPIAAYDLKSPNPKPEPCGPGRITAPPPRSSATSSVYAVLPLLPVTRVPARGELIVRVYATCSGVSKRSNPSRKNGRFSGKNTAKRRLTVICAMSASICEKSGLMVRSSVLFAVGFHFTSRPASVLTSPLFSALPSSAPGCESRCAVT
jgi:hypothetical protein